MVLQTTFAPLYKTSVASMVIHNGSKPPFSLLAQCHLTPASGQGQVSDFLGGCWYASNLPETSYFDGFAHAPLSDLPSNACVGRSPTGLEFQKMLASQAAAAVLMKHHLAHLTQDEKEALATQGVMQRRTKGLLLQLHAPETAGTPLPALTAYALARLSVLHATFIGSNEEAYFCYPLGAWDATDSRKIGEVPATGQARSALVISHNVLPEWVPIKQRFGKEMPGNPATTLPVNIETKISLTYGNDEISL